MITLHQFQISPFCDKVRRILHWKRLDYRIQEVPLARALSVRRINPIGKLPCLEHDGRFVADSTDIAYYLEEKFPEPPILPKDPLAARSLPRPRRLGGREPLLLRDAAPLHPAPERQKVDSGAGPRRSGRPEIAGTSPDSGHDAAAHPEAGGGTQVGATGPRRRGTPRGRAVGPARRSRVAGR